MDVNFRSRSGVSLPQRRLRRARLGLARLAPGLACLLLTGCTAVSPAQQKLLQEGQSAYEAQQYQTAVDKLGTFLAQVTHGPQASQALYLRGASLAASSRRSQAIADLERCVKLSADADSTWRALVALGTLHFEDGEWEKSRAALMQAADRMPRRPPLDTVLYRIGLCSERTGRWLDARRAFQRLVNEFPSSGAAGAARRRLAINASSFAVQAGSFTNNANAERLAADFRQRGFDAYTQREPRAGQVVTVVLIGKFQKYEAMLSHLGAVRAVEPTAVPWP